MIKSNKQAALFAAFCLSTSLFSNNILAASADKKSLDDSPSAPLSLERPDQNKPEDANSEDPIKLPPRLPLNELRIFAEVFNRVSEAYVEEIDDKSLLENAIRGMLSQLDPHSSYLDRESFTDLQENTTGNYGGLGLEVSMDGGFLRIISPMDDTPADKAGLETGDIILQLNDTPIKGMSLGDAIEGMRGKPGSEVKLMIVREGIPKPEEFTLTREVIKVASVRHRTLEEGYGYLRIAQFQSGTGDEVKKAVGKMVEDGNLQGLILDLRNNPGGVLQSAVAVSDVFIDEGLIVYTTGRMRNSDLRFSATTPDITDGVPLVVLVNGGSASASEIVAGALQDHGRAVIMGVDTFGKGSVQTILPLNNEKAIKLTTALYFTPNGRSIQAEGIVPDIQVARSKVTKVSSNPFRIKERDLAKHLQNGNGREEKDEGADTDEKRVRDAAQKVASKDLASTDYQLNEALTLLKGHNILSAKTTPPKG
ncbi:MAG: carboxyl-terminal processing protease [Flavobacterium sp.]|jgi:carboxyl-terminal processing protease